MTWIEKADKQTEGSCNHALPAGVTKPLFSASIEHLSWQALTSSPSYTAIVFTSAIIRSSSLVKTNRQALNQLHNRISGVPPNFAFPMFSTSSTTSSIRLLLLLPAVRDCNRDQLLHSEGIRTIVKSDIAHHWYYCSLFIQFSDFV